MILLNDTDLEYAVRDVLDELRRAREMHGPMASHHEAQSVIGEEFHEMTLAVWFGVDQKGRSSDPHDEAIQLAAMCLRYLLDVPRRDKRRHVIRLVAYGAGHDPAPICDACEQPWPCGASS